MIRWNCNNLVLYGFVYFNLISTYQKKDWLTWIKFFGIVKNDDFSYRSPTVSIMKRFRCTSLHNNNFKWFTEKFPFKSKMLGCDGKGQTRLPIWRLQALYFKGVTPTAIFRRIWHLEFIFLHVVVIYYVRVESWYCEELDG